VVFAEFTVGNALVEVLSIFFFVIWIWILIVIFTDLFRDHDLSGWWKAVWVLVLFAFPFVTALIYLIARGGGMRDRAIKEQVEAKKHFDAYVKETAGAASTSDELAKLGALKEKGALNDAEYEQAKAKLLA
jgi:hypothetical protein